MFFGSCLRPICKISLEILRIIIFMSAIGSYWLFGADPKTIFESWKLRHNPKPRSHMCESGFAYFINLCHSIIK